MELTARQKRYRRYREHLLADPEMHENNLKIRHALYKKHKEEYRRKQREYSQRLRDEAIVKLGGKCAKCGITDIRVLQIDHINGGGERERTKGRRYQGILLDIRDKSEEYIKQHYHLLCANCNWIKRYERGEHNQF